MDGKQRQTLEAVFADPVPLIEWEAIEDLLILIGCRVVQDDDERVTFDLDGAIGSFQRPPLRRPTLHSTVFAVRDYLTQVGVTP